MRFLFFRGISIGCFLSFASSLLAVQPSTLELVAPSEEQRMSFQKPAREVRMVQPGFIWIDAEDFTEYGGWKLDTQFVQQMGSGYLLAAGNGTPVRNAQTTFSIPAAGRWRVWVRTKNWNKEHAPGQFKIKLNGTLSGKTLGCASTEAWCWETAGGFDLSKGPVHIELVDQTGYFGRCDAVILTTDQEYVPPSSMEQIRQERARLVGFSLEPQFAGEFDVIVVGGGVAGCTAALSAARNGARVALIQDRPVLGGNGSAELGVSIDGAGENGKSNARESGLVEEVGRIRAEYGYMKFGMPFRVAMRDEPNLAVFFNQRVNAVEMSNAHTIASVRSVDTLTNEINEFNGRVFVDCTGDGWVGYFAGAEYRLGREGQGEFNESLAPESPDSVTMSGTLLGVNETGLRRNSFQAKDAGHPVRYEAPPWAAQLPSDFYRSNLGIEQGRWWLEYQGTMDDLYQPEKARDELFRIVYGYWDFIKNDWRKKELAANYELVFVPYMSGRRETRRLVGDYTLTQNDVMQAVPFEDAVAHGGWPLDVHHPLGVYSPDTPAYCNSHLPVYSIPFRCLYSVNISNLLFAGRDASVSHLALGTTRVQGTTAVMGQAAGTAAAMCAAREISPRELYQTGIQDLQQQLVKDDQYIPGVRNEDSEDLAQLAVVTASSEKTFEQFSWRRLGSRSHTLNTARGMMFARGTLAHMDSISFFLSSKSDQPVELSVHVRGAQAIDDFSAEEDLASGTVHAVPGAGNWVEFPVPCDIETPYVWVWLDESKDVDVHISSDWLPDASRVVCSRDEWATEERYYYVFKTEPAYAFNLGFSARNVINGYSRIIGTNANQWASDPAASMPQWIELEFDKPTAINSIYLTFDTDMHPRDHLEARVPQCVKDYRLSVFDGKAWQDIAQVSENYQRRRIHRFDEINASKVRLTVLATNGDPSARVFEIRAHNQSFATEKGPANVSVRQFGAIPNDGVCDLEAINNAITEAARRSPAQVVFEAGTYNLSEVPGERSVLISSGGVSNVTLLGQTDGEGNPVTRLERNVTMLDNDLDVAAQIGIYDCTNVTIKNIISDNTPAFATGGRITKVDRDSDTVEVEIFPDAPHFDGMKCYSANSWNLKTRELLPVPALTIGVGKERFSHVWEKVPGNNDRLYRLQGMKFSQWVEAEQGLSWHFYVVGKGRQFELDRNVNTTFENVRICNIKGLGVMATNCRDLTFSKVVLKSDSAVPAVGARDAFHMICNDGNLLVKDCFVQGVRWDPFNIKSRFCEVLEIENPRTLRCRTRVGIRLLPIEDQPLVFWVGERPLEIGAKSIHWDDGEPGGEGRFAMADFTLELSENLPSAVQVGSLFTPQAWTFDSAELLNTSIVGNYGRAILYQGENLKVLNCTFKNNAYADLALGPINDREGGFVRNVLVEGCSFSGSGWNTHSGAWSGMISVFQNYSEKFSTEAYNEKMVFRNNKFDGACADDGMAAIALQNAQDVMLRDNQFARFKQIVLKAPDSTKNISEN